MEIPTAEEANGGTMSGLSYVLQEEARLAQVWTAQDRVEHENGLRDIADRFHAIQRRLEGLRSQTEAVWERFIILTLERILSGQLRDFLDETDTKVYGLNSQLIELDCEIDRLRACIQERRRWLEEKSAALEPLAHRTSTQNHLAMMLSRVEGLEAYLLGWQDGLPEAGEAHYQRYTALPGDLLYLRVRLLTTRIAIIASNRSRHMNELDAELTALLPDAGRLKAELAALMTRVESMSELSHYWLAYLKITQ